MSPNLARRVTVTVNGKAYTVEVSDLDASPLIVTVNGRPYEVYLADGEWEAVSVKTPATAGQAVPHQMPVPVKTPIGSSGSTVNEVRAPMPGNIVSIAVQPGDKVARGEQLCVLEAMKMKSLIRSPRDGVIAEIKVSAGQAVGYGEVLLTFA